MKKTKNKKPLLKSKTAMTAEIKKVLSKYKGIDAESKFDVLNTLAQQLRNKF